MGKRKKNARNVVRVDITECLVKGETLPVLAQHSSKDGRRIEQVVHHIPTLHQDPHPSTFNPSPVFESGQDCDSRMDGSANPEHVRLFYLSFKLVLTRILTVGPPAGLVWGIR